MVDRMVDMPWEAAQIDEEADRQQKFEDRALREVLGSWDVKGAKLHRVLRRMDAAPGQMPRLTCEWFNDVGGFPLYLQARRYARKQTIGGVCKQLVGGYTKQLDNSALVRDLCDLREAYGDEPAGILTQYSDARRIWILHTAPVDLLSEGSAVLQFAYSGCVFNLQSLDIFVRCFRSSWNPDYLTV